MRDGVEGFNCMWFTIDNAVGLYSLWDMHMLRRYNMCILSKQRGVVWSAKEFDRIITRFTDVHTLVTRMPYE